VGRQAEKWFETVDKHFGFLREARFTHLDTDDSSFWSLWVQYRSDSAAIRISKSNEFTRSEVELIRLVDGEVPPYPIWITDARIDWILLDNVVMARKPALQDEVRNQSGLKPAEIESQLGFWARTLRDVAQDFIDGDPAPIDEAGALVRARVAAEPQQVQVYLPSDAPPGAEAEEAAKVRATVPPNVGVTVRRYFRRGNRR